MAVDDFAFKSTGNAEQDETIRVRARRSFELRGQGLCPNECGPLMESSPWDRDCPKCGFKESSNTPWRPDSIDPTDFPRECGLVRDIVWNEGTGSMGQMLCTPERAAEIEAQVQWLIERNTSLKDIVNNLNNFGLTISEWTTTMFNLGYLNGRLDADRER